MSKLEQTYIYKLDRLKLLIQKEIDKILSDRGQNLTMSQFFLMFAVKDLTRPNQSQLASYLNVSPPAISRQVDVAEKAGLVKVSKGGDLNQSILSLTDEGLESFNRAYETVNNHLAYIFQDSENLAGLSSHLDNLLIKSKKEES